MVAEFMGWQKYLHLRSESSWGVRAANNPDILVPYTSYGVATNVVATQADLFTGLRQRRHNRIQRATLTGGLSLPLFAHHVAGKSLAQHLLEWGLSSPTSPMLDSMTADVFEANTDNKRHLGLRVRSMTLAGDADAGTISLELELDGKEETGGIAPPALVMTAPQPVEFLFDDVEMYLSEEPEAETATDASERLEIRGFRLRIDNNLKSYHTNSFYPSCVVAGVRAVSFQFTIFKTSNFLDSLRRTNAVSRRACRLQLKGRHLGTGPSGEFTTINIYFDQLNFTGATDDVRLNDLVSQSAEWVAIKPSTTGSDVEMVFGVSS
jgi:hypothetical protein